MLWDCSIVKSVIEGTPHNLLESVAHQISSTTFSKHPQISAVRVKVGKPHVAVQGQLDYLGVEIFRSRAADGQIWAWSSFNFINPKPSLAFLFLIIIFSLKKEICAVLLIEYYMVCVWMPNS